MTKEQADKIIRLLDDIKNNLIGGMISIILTLILSALVLAVK